MVDWRWCEEEKAFPFKKRIGSFERKSNEENVMEKDKKMKTKMKTKKCMQQNGIEEGGGGGVDNGTKELTVDRGSSSIARKRIRGGALMEGSRCSRVNGRGWRCCQQTLVGYSLCEHHLGKGRLRSMNSVRSRSMANAAPKNGESQPLSNPSYSSLPGEGKTEGMISLDDNVGIVPYGDEEEKKKKKPLMNIAKKKQKLGMVKARSISSLLGQADNVIEVWESDE